MDRINALRNLSEASLALKGINKPFWITDGTLLGFYREGNFIAHDNDIDLGMYIDDWSENIIYAFVKSGFKHIKTYGTNNRGLVYSFKKYSIKIDIFFFYKDGEKCWHAAWPYKNFLANTKIIKWLGLSKPSMIKFYYPIFEIEEMKFNEQIFPVPKPPEQYLIIKYGPNWKTPVKNWNWATSPHNVQKD